MRLGRLRLLALALSVVILIALAGGFVVILFTAWVPERAPLTCER